MGLWGLNAKRPVILGDQRSSCILVTKYIRGFWNVKKKVEGVKGVLRTMG